MSISTRQFIGTKLFNIDKFEVPIDFSMNDEIKIDYFLTLVVNLHSIELTEGKFCKVFQTQIINNWGYPHVRKNRASC